MQITEEMLPKIEKHFGIKLHSYQKYLLLHNYEKEPICIKGGRLSGKLFISSLVNAAYNNENIEVDCITNEHAKEVYKSCLDFIKKLNGE